MTEIVEFWEFNFDLNIITHLPCGTAWNFKSNNNQISEATKIWCLDHQKTCLATRMSLSNKQISREEWEDNMQRSRQKDSVDKKRDDIFKEIFN